MAVNENIGSVSVLITGDATPLNAAFSAAQSSAQAAGANVAAAFSSGSGAVSGLTTATEEAAASEAGFAAATEEANAALGHQVSQLQATSGAIRTALGEQSIRAAERFLTLIPGLGAALQVAFPVIGAIALASAIGRVIEKSEDLKSAEKELQSQTEKTDQAFGQMVTTIDRINVKSIGRQFGPAAEAKAEAARLGAEANDAREKIQGLQSDIKQIAIEAESHYVKAAIAGFGDVNGFVEATNDKIKAKGQEIQALQAKILGLVKESDDQLDDSTLKGVQQAGQLASARISAQQSALSKETEMAKAVAESQIFTLRNTAAEELRVAQEKETAITAVLERELPKRLALIRAQGAADSAGKTNPERDRIDVETAGKVSDAESDAAREAYTLHQETVNAERALYKSLTEEVTREWEKSEEVKRKAQEKTLELQLAPAAISFQQSEAVSGALAKGAGQDKQLQIQTQKLQAERAYGLETSHNAQQQIAQAQTLAAFDAQARQAKLAGLQREYQIQAQQMAELPAADEKRVESARRLAALYDQINKLSQENADADYRDETIIQEKTQALTQQLTLQQQIDSAGAAAQSTYQNDQKNIGANIGQQIGGLPKAVGDDIGGAISNALLSKHPGESIGKAMAQGLIDSLKQTLAGVLKSIISGGFQFGIGALFGGFAEGGPPPIGVPSMVGEKGPELFVPRQAGTIIPNHMLKGYADGAGIDYLNSTSTSSSTSYGDMHFHAHGMTNPDKFVDHVMRTLPDKLKSRSSQFSPYSK